MKITTQNICFLLVVFHFNAFVLGKDYCVKDNGAKADGKTDDAKAFEATFKAACADSGDVTITVPKGDYFLGPVKFEGPCKGVKSMTINMEGQFWAETNLDKFPDGDWILFANIDGLTVKGGGVFDGQGKTVWQSNDCQKNKQCKLLPTNLKFMNLKNTYVEGITSQNSKNFNFGIVGCTQFKATNIKVDNPGDSPNTDGMHIERCSDVSISNAKIATGDDCISLGQGLNKVDITGITCGPGHGISVGSLGKYEDEKDVEGLTIKDCTITNTLNGVRIKSWPNSPSESKVSNVIFESITMKDVCNPIIIDQDYCPGESPGNQPPSKVKISDVTFSKISGTTGTEDAVSLICSKAYPCENIKLTDINIKSNGSCAIKSVCENVKPIYSGEQSPSACTY